MIHINRRRSRFLRTARNRSFKSGVEKRLQRFSFVRDAHKSCALLRFMYSCPEGDLNPFGYVLPVRPLRDACARFRRHPCRLFLAPARRSLRPSSPEYFLIAINVLRSYFFLKYANMPGGGLEPP